MAELLVADSFRVRLNPKTGLAEARGFQQHLDRFRLAALEAWCGKHEPSAEERRLADEIRAQHRAMGVNTSSLLIIVAPQYSPRERQALDLIESFLADAVPRIADSGEGWPRLELWRDPASDAHELELRLRPLPELGDTIELRTAGRVDAEHPERKGPNIARYAALNRELGAEALLVDERGHVLEGATTSLVWWPSDPDGPEQYGAIAESPRRVPSVTESLIARAAGGRLVGVKPDRRRIGQPQPSRVRPAHLAAGEHEVWAVNALHGIRVVTAIDGVPLPAPHERRLRWFREALDRAWEPVAPAGA